MNKTVDTTDILRLLSFIAGCQFQARGGRLLDAANMVDQRVAIVNVMALRDQTSMPPPSLRSHCGSRLEARTAAP
eukprot:703516-Pyramimonas_sp.AAC.1